MVVTARSLAPDLAIVARSRDAQQAGRLYQLAAGDVVPETIEASLWLSEALLSRIGMPPDAVVALYRGHRPRGWRAPLEGVKGLRGSLAALAPAIAATTRGTSDN